MHGSVYFKQTNTPAQFTGHVSVLNDIRCGNGHLDVYTFDQLVAWHSGRTSVSDWRTFPVLRLTCS